MKNNKFDTLNITIPKLRPIKPKKALHQLDRLIHNLEEARELYETILGHQRAFMEQVSERQAKTNPDGEGTPLRAFVGTNPLDEWYDVTETRYQVVTLLEKQGLIATIRIGGRYYSRVAQ